jgi:hypothetical protein
MQNKKNILAPVCRNKVANGQSLGFEVQVDRA